MVHSGESCLIIVINPGWWLTYPSEKYESQLWLLFPIVWKKFSKCAKPPTRKSGLTWFSWPNPCDGEKETWKSTCESCERVWIQRTFRACEFKQFEGAVSCCESPAFLVEFPSMASPYATSLGLGFGLLRKSQGAFGYPPVIWNSNPKSTSPMVLPIKLRG